MHELTLPSRWPGWTSIAGIVVGALLGVHASLAAFAHDAMGYPGSWMWHVVGTEGWQASGILVRCMSSALFAGVVPGYPRPPASYQRWCQQWWRAVDGWTRDAGTSFFGATILLMSVVGTGAYLCALRRLVPHGPGRRRTTAYATIDQLHPFLRPRGVSPQEMVRAGALPLGHIVAEAGRRRGPDLWLPLPYRRQHIWMLGVTGVGKTSGVIKRWLAADAMLDGIHAPVKMSTVAVDVKDPDLWEFTAPVAQQYDRRVMRWAPMGPDSMGHNFLDYVHTPGDTLEMAETILTNDPEYNRKDPFWRQTELNMLATTIQLVCEEPADRLMNDLLLEKMQNVLGVAPPPRSLAFIFGLSHLHPSEFMAYIERVDGPRTVWRDRYSKVFQARDDRTIGTWQGLQNVLVIFRDPDVIAATSRSDFHLSMVAHQPTTLIIGLPRKPGSRRQVLTALFLRQLLQALGDITRQQESHQLPVPVTLLLDELAVLGLIPTFQDFVATYRDMGVAFVVATQDRAQLIDVYGKEKADVIIANLHTRIIFGRDLRPEQAEEICRALGERLVPEPGVQYEHRSPLSVVRRGTRMTYQVRRLLEPNELRAFPEFRAVAVLPGDLKVRVDLPPVHTDPAFRGATLQIGTLEALHHDIQMDRVLGRPIAASGIPQAPFPVPRRRELVPPPELPRSSPRPSKSPDAEPWTGPGSSVPDAESPGPSQDPGTQTDVVAADPQSAVHMQETTASTRLLAAHSDKAGGQSAEEAPQASNDGATSADRAPVAAPHPLGIGSPIVSLIAEVLHGSLRDERLAPGSPPGWVFEDKRGEFLVPWGFLRDWAFKTQRRFTDLEAAWVRDGVAHGRASVMAQGRSITCVLFSKRAAVLLPPQLRQTLAQSFAKISATAVRLSTARAGKEWGPDLLDRAKRNAQGSADRPPPPRLLEFLQALDQAGIHFIGHPARDRDPPVHGRWRASAKGGDQILLVERKAAKVIFASVGVADPVEVLRLWKQAGVLHVGGQVRGEFYTRRTHPEGNEFLALRWDEIGRYLPAAGSTEDSSRSDAAGTVRPAGVSAARTTP